MNTDADINTNVNNFERKFNTASSKNEDQYSRNTLHPNKFKHENSSLFWNKANMNIKEASDTVRKKLADTLGKKANSTSSIVKEGEKWNAIVEIIEEEYLPGKNLKSMSDIIGVYDVSLSDKGEILSYTKKSSHRRGNAQS